MKFCLKFCLLGCKQPSFNRKIYRFFETTGKTWFSPYTVDAGHLQIETDFATMAFNKQNRRGINQKSRATKFMLHNIKLGLTNSSDLQIFIESFNISHIKDLNTGLVNESSGFGDITVRYKYNFFGNDFGKAALGIMPFIKIPTNQNDLGNNNVEGGVILPFALDLGHGYNLGLMTQINIVRNYEDNGYRGESFNTITVGKSLTDKLGIFSEFALSTRFESHSDWPITYDMGITYAVNNDLQLDAGVFIGLTESADDYNPFIGITYRY